MNSVINDGLCQTKSFDICLRMMCNQPVKFQPATISTNNFNYRKAIKGGLTFNTVETMFGRILKVVDR